jgi:hypothetical protein
MIMKKLMTALLLTVFCTSLVYAQSGAPATGADWLKVNKKAREQLVTSFIQDMKKEGVIITKSPVFYCKKLDALYERKTNLLGDPVWKVLKTAMIMECDWSVKGKDPDVVAKEWLGEKLYKRWQEKWGECHAQK